MENKNFKKTIDLNVIIPKFLNSLNSIVLNKVNQKLKFLNFYQILVRKPSPLRRGGGDELFLAAR